MPERYDNSMLGCFSQECQRKSFFQYEHHLVNPRKREALQFGQGIHSGLDQFFAGRPVDQAIGAFMRDVPTDLDEEKRTVENGKTILRAYYRNYGSISPFKRVVSIEKGMSIRLRDFEFFGLLDKVVDWDYGVTAVDHKTTSSYLSNYGKSVQPNHQFSGYIEILRQNFENAWGLVVDAVHVGRKYKDGYRTEFARFMTTRGEWEIEEWKRWAQRTVDGIRRARETGEWLMFTNECTAFNSTCPYKALCEVPHGTLQETLDYAISSDDYIISKWEPWNRTKEEII